MSNLLQRILLFFLGVPAIIALIVLFPQRNHGAVVFFIIIFTGGCGFELSRLFKARGVGASPTLFTALGAIVPASAYLGGLLGSATALSGACLGLVLAFCSILLASFAQYAFIGD
jgi:phosphatidate cytidylyltransferase